MDNRTQVVPHIRETQQTRNSNQVTIEGGNSAQVQKGFGLLAGVAALCAGAVLLTSVLNRNAKDNTARKLVRTTTKNIESHDEDDTSADEDDYDDDNN